MANVSPRQKPNAAPPMPAASPSPLVEAPPPPPPQLPELPAAPPPAAFPPASSPCACSWIPWVVAAGAIVYAFTQQKEA